MAGGKGTRLRPLTCDRPKPMVPLANRPMMEHIVRLLADHGYRDIAVTMFYLPEVIKAYFGDGSPWGVNLSYYVEETPLGTAGSVMNAAGFFEDTFLVISGDALTDFDLREAVQFHKENNAMVTILLTKVEAPLEYGVVITDAQGRIRQFLEKPSWGEVFSDTVNTGIYILEPEIFQYIPPGQPYDFSKDLFPRLLAAGCPMYGYVASGYWSDIGNLEQYRQSHYDLLAGKIRLQLPGREVSPGVWAEANVHIDPTAQIQGPILIGQNTWIGPGAQIEGYSVLGANCIVDGGASLKRTLVWDHGYIGHDSQLRGAILCSKVRIKDRAAAYEGVVIGDGSTVGKEAVLRPGVKVWPGKSIDSGSTIADSLVWGSRWSRSLFGSQGIHGLVNVDLTVELAGKLGAALGAIMPPKSQLVVGADSYRPSRMLKRAFIAGLLSTGIDVFDLGTTTTPVARHAVVASGAQGGVHIHLLPQDPRCALFKFFDERGLNFDKNQERKLENSFFCEDFRRAPAEGIGDLAFLPRIAEHYVDELLGGIDVDRITKARFRIVVDYHGTTLSLLLPAFLERLGCQAEVIEGEEGEGTRGAQQFLFDVGQLAQRVVASGAHLGIAVDNSGERLILVDELGNVITDELFLAIISLLAFKGGEGGTIAVPVTASGAIEKLAAQYKGRVIRTKANPRSVMEKAIEEKIFLGRRGLPHFQLVFDAIVSLGKVLELMALDGVSLSALVAQIPQFYMQQETIPCPWEDKGKVMRKLIEATAREKVELIDGVKVHHDRGWTLILPDGEEPVFRIYSEGDSPEEADALLQAYMGKIEEMRLS
jgi:mannose-1-phosphate guanylyltransferase/phosphomannomutase